MATTKERPAATVDAGMTATPLDPVTFEVLKNSFVNLVDEVDEGVFQNLEGDRIELGRCRSHVHRFGRSFSRRCHRVLLN